MILHVLGAGRGAVRPGAFVPLGDDGGRGLMEERRIPWGRLALCAVALALTFAEYWLLNYCAFPLFDTVFVWTREVSAAVGGLVLAGFAVASFWTARAAHARLFVWGVPVAMLAGALIVAGGVVWDSAALVCVGASLVTVGTGFANVFVGMGCIGLSLRQVAVIVAGAYAASYATRQLFEVLPLPVNLSLFVILPLVSMACVGGWARRFLEGLGGAESPAQMSVTAPRSFLPFTHQVFVALVIFRFVYGYTLTFGEVDRVPVTSLWALVPLAILFVCTCVSRRPIKPDLLFKLSILCSVVGFLVVSITGEERDALVQGFLSTGTGLFEVLMYYALIAIGAKNPAGALPALAWGNAMASWGTIIGATFGRMTNHADAMGVDVVSSAIVMALVVYMLFVLPRFSFARTIEEVDPAEEVRVPELASRPADRAGEGSAAVDPLDERCRALAERGMLTDREYEVLRLLAHGRNARFIQESLAISYSTTKTHVSHIYRKLGVHAHQELLDLVERQ